MRRCNNDHIIDVLLRMRTEYVVLFEVVLSRSLKREEVRQPPTEGTSRKQGGG